MLRVVLIGLGPVGLTIARYITERKGMRLVGAVDRDADLVGKSLVALGGRPSPRLKVSAALEDVLRRRTADVAVISTRSSLKHVEPTILEAVAAGLHVVTTCEELSYPWRTHRARARRIDAACREAGIACVGTGVNPGFLMDFLPAALSSVCRDVKAVRVTRVLDASRRRVPFQKKIGAGLSRTEFRRLAAKGTLRHVGLPESVDMIAAALGWKLDRVTESLQPVLATRSVQGGYTPIAKGMARGVDQVARGYQGRREVIRLRFLAAVGEPASHDTVEIDGTPSIRSVIDGGVHGDTATGAITVNAVPAIVAATPGLRTMLDLPLPSCRLGRA